MLHALKNLFRGRRAPQPRARTWSPNGNAGAEQAGSDPRDSEAHFSQLVAGVRDYAVFLLDARGNVRTWNAGAEQIKGYRPEEIIGRHFSQFYPRDAAASGWPAHALDVAAATGQFKDEGWRVRKDGTRFWASVVITALRDDAGNIGGYLKITRDQTDRKQAEEKLRFTEERFRLLVENVRDYAILMLDPEGRIATWNAGAERLKGYSAQEIIGQHFSVFYPRQAIELGVPDEKLKQAAAEGRVEDEGWRVRKDGSLFWANVVITVLRDETGELKGFAKITKDLTERRNAEANARRLLQEEAARAAAEQAAREIEREREQLRVTLASIGDAVVVTDANGVVRFLNPVAVNLTGWEAEEAAGKPLDEVFHIINEETREPVASPVDKVLRERTIVTLANRTVLVGKGGREVPIEDSAAPIRTASDQVDGVVLVFRDVSAARRAMEDRNYLASIVESSDDAIIGQTLDGRIASWNRGAERLYGYAAEDILGHRLTELVPPELPNEIPTIIDRLARGETIEHFETQRLRKDGRRVDVSLTISPVRNADGKVIGASKIARDITARKEEERRKDEFLALLAHELRNPLAPIRNALQIVRLATEDRRAVGESVTMMERQLEHLVRLVDDLLDVSRISQGKLHLRKEPARLDDVVRHALHICGALAGQTAHEFAVSVPDEPINIIADKTRVAQAICNLLSNAVKYSEPGSRVQLTVRQENDEAVISVKDSGVGIPPEMLPRVFDLFWQADQTLEKSQGGLGVGLAIVKQMIEMHGGTVEAHSEGAGKGSEFIIRLPVAPAPADDRRDRTPEFHARPGERCRVLVADDNDDSVRALARIIKLKGHEVRTAHDGQEAVEAADLFHPNLVLLDLGMPRLNGYDAARRIREQPWGKKAVLVAVTGWDQEDDRERSKKAGLDFHIVKPLEPAVLDRLLARSVPHTA
jgi:PAS domain S-box-containing protein